MRENIQYFKQLTKWKCCIKKYLYFLKYFIYNIFTPIQLTATKMFNFKTKLNLTYFVIFMLFLIKHRTSITKICFLCF